MHNVEKFYLKIAELVAEIDSNYSSAKRRCVDYIVDAPERVDIVAKTSPNEIAVEKSKSAQDFSDEYCEFVCLYRSIAEKLPFFDGFVFHGAAVEVNGKAYVFTAPSGTGKSTHIKLWMDALGEKVRVINGDKPILRKKDGGFIVTLRRGRGKRTGTAIFPRRSTRSV